MLVQSNGPVTPHSNNMIEKIGHPKHAASFLNFNKIATLRGRRTSLVDGVINLMVAHSLYQAKSSTGAHPCCAVIGTHGLKSHDKYPCLTEFSVDAVMLSALYTEILENLLRFLVEWLYQVSELHR